MKEEKQVQHLIDGLPSDMHAVFRVKFIGTDAKTTDYLTTLSSFVEGELRFSQSKKSITHGPTVEVKREPRSNASTSRVSRASGKPEKRTRAPECSYCNKKGHQKSMCWKFADDNGLPRRQSKNSLERQRAEKPNTVNQLNTSPEN